MSGTEKRVIIAGGGAAGFFCAVNLAEMNPELEVVILEAGNKLLAKVLVSGGGRCNATHHCFENNLLITNYPRGERELRNVFSKFSVRDTIAWFEKHGVKLKTEEDGRMFPVSNSSETIVNCFLQSAKTNKVKVFTGKRITAIEKETDGFSLKINQTETMRCKRLVIAIGGNPKSSFYEMIKKIGHTVLPPIPSLFTFNIRYKKLNELMGLSVSKAEVTIKQSDFSFSGPLLITHWGLSGPAILKLSAYAAQWLHDCAYQFDINVNWTGEAEADKISGEFKRYCQMNGKLTLNNQSYFLFPKRLWHYFIFRAGIDGEKRLAELSGQELKSIFSVLFTDAYKVEGKTTFKDEFVTCGGVELKEVDLRTMKSKIHDGLFFCGEVLNVDGITGGFNFQACWSTGFIAAKSIAESNWV